jgi:O-antigen biosynthesis protein
MASDRNALVPVWLEADGRLRQSRIFSDFEPDRWYLFVDGDARLHPHLTERLAVHSAKRPEIDIFYGDEVVGETSPPESGTQLCKPSFDRTQIIAQDYIGWPILVRGRAIARLGGIDPSSGTAVTYDLILRALSEGVGIERIAEVLAVHHKAPPRSNVADRAAAVERWRERSSPWSEILPGMVEGTLQLRRNFPDPPPVTLVVPTRQGLRSGAKGDCREDYPMILDLLDSLGRTEWPMDRLLVLVGDDVEEGCPYDRMDWPFRLERIWTARREGEAFNYAAKINRLWPLTHSENLVLMNDDVIVRGGEWLRAMMTFALSEEVGGVGARLLYPDDTLQHAGMPGGVLGPCTHAFVHRPASLRSYQNWAEVHREWSMVTGAVFATRRSVLEQANGFDESFPLDYNDVDLCLRLRLLGYRIIYTPFAELTHHESATRSGIDTPADQLALFMERWQELLNDDPAYHPRLTRASPDIVPVRTGEDWWVIPPDNAASKRQSYSMADMSG